MKFTLISLYILASVGSAFTPLRRGGVGRVFSVAVSSLTTPLFDWAISEGATISSGVSIGPTLLSERGLVATRRIEKDELLIALPAALQLGPPTTLSLGDDLGKILSQTSAPGLWAANLGLGIIFEERLGEKSLFAPYLDCLPLTLSSALAPDKESGFGFSTEAVDCDASPAFANWPPTADKVGC
jgi:hypothetical protein